MLLPFLLMTFRLSFRATVLVRPRTDTLQRAAAELDAKKARRVAVAEKEAAACAGYGTVA